MKTNQPIVVLVHNSQALSRAVQEIAFENGIYWIDGNKTFISDPVISSGSECAAINIQRDYTGKTSMMHAPKSYYENSSDYKKVLFLDAKTDLGKLIDLLQKPKPPVGPEINGSVAEHKKGDKYVTFGCAQIDLDLLETIAEAMGYSVEKNYQVIEDLVYQGNRTVFSIKLSSKVELTKQDIKAILDYVHAVIKHEEST